MFPSCLATFEEEFDANLLLLHVINFSRSIQSQNSTNMTLQKSTKQHTCPHSRPLLGRVVHKGYRLRYLAAHNCTTGGFQEAFQFQGLMASTMYSQSIVCVCSVSCVTVIVTHCHSEQKCLRLPMNVLQSLILISVT